MTLRSALQTLSEKLTAVLGKSDRVESLGMDEFANLDRSNSARPGSPNPPVGAEAPRSGGRAAAWAATRRRGLYGTPPTGLRLRTILDPPNPVKRSPGVLLGLTFVVALLLGWLVIGWWLWPVRWTDSAPSDLHPEYQKAFVRLVAGDYWRTRDVFRAREILASWDDETLAELVATMEKEAVSAETRQQLAALAEMLELPYVETSLLASLFDQKVVILGAIFSMLPLAVAMILIVSPLRQSVTQQPSRLLAREKAQLEEELEALAREPEQSERRSEKLQDQEGQTQEEKAQEEQTQERKAQEGQAQDQEGQPQARKENLLIEEEEEIDEEETGSLQDLLFDVFVEDEEDMLHLAALCKSLEDIDADDLLQETRLVASQLQRGNALGLQPSLG